MCTSQRPQNGADSAPIPDPYDLDGLDDEPGGTIAGPLLSCDLCSRYRADLSLILSGGIVLRRCGACRDAAIQREAAMLASPVS